MEINSNNLHQIRNFVKNLRSLNRFVKDNFNKSERENLSIYPILNKSEDLNKELCDLENQINKYLLSESKNYLRKGMYLKGSIGIYYGEKHSYIFVKTNPGKTRITIDIISFGEETFRYNTNYEYLCRTLIDSILDGNLIEISKEEYNETLNIYKEIKKQSDKIFKNDIK